MRKNFEEMDAFEIMEELCERRDECYENDTIDEFNFDGEYEMYFKALAEKTNGSMLINEFCDCIEDENAEMINRLQIQWLKDIGKDETAEWWLAQTDDLFG